MLFFDCDVQEVVTEKMKRYFENNSPSFELLKFFILSKAPIPQIQTDCIRQLKSIHENALTEVTKKLCAQSYKKQIKEDDDEALLLHEEAQRDKREQLNLKGKLNAISHKRALYESNKKGLQTKLLQEIASVTFNKFTQSKTEETNNSSDQSLEHIKNSISNYDRQIKSLSTQELTLNKQLHAIHLREMERKEHLEQQSNRAQARIGYEVTGGGILAALSQRNQNQLQKSIGTQEKHLLEKCEAYVKDAEAMNFSLFLKLLPEHLKHMQLSSPEKEALRHCTQFMNKHLQAQQQTATIKESLKTKIRSINHSLSKLSEYKKQLEQIGKDTPHLKQSIISLSEKNMELQRDFEQHLKMRKKLSTTAMLLLTFTFLFTIPLILACYGVIPFFIAPVALYLLVSVPPAALLLATISVGVATLVFHSKARSDVITTELNRHTIVESKNQTKLNDEGSRQLKTITIPGMEKQLKRDEQLREELKGSLEKTEQVAKDALMRANAVKPIAYSRSTLLPAAPETELFVDVPDEIITYEKP